MSATETPEPVVETTVTPEPTVEGAKPETDVLGKPGLDALQKERDARAAAEKAAVELSAKLKEYEDRDKSEADKAAERAAELERENAELKAGKLRAEVASAKGVPANLLSGSTQAELEASADALIAFRGEAPKPSAASLIEKTNQVTPETDLNAAIAAAQQARNFPLVATLKQQQAALLKG